MEAALQVIYNEENAPSAYQLYKLARKAGHTFTKQKVDAFVKRQAAAQVLTAKKAPGRVVGKFQATRKTRSGNSTCSIAAPNHPNWTECR